MNRYVEIGYTYSALGTGTYTEVYDQPRWRHFWARIYCWYSDAFMKVMPWKQIEKIDYWLHRRRCNQDCMTGEVWKRGQGSKIETYCAHMPFTCRQDCRYFDLTQRDRTRISFTRSELAEEVDGRVDSEGPSQPL